MRLWCVCVCVWYYVVVHTPVQMYLARWVQFFYTIAKLSKGFKVPEFEENEEYKWKIISSDKVQNVLGYEFIHDNLLSIKD